MKRVDLIAHLKKCGCRFVRQGGNHEIYANQSGSEITAIPRHREIKKFTAKQICKDLDISFP
jgi:mRNA interferase HicA